MPLIWLRRHYLIWLMIIRYLARGVALLSCVCLLFISSASLLTTRIDATAPTSTYYANNELYLSGTLLYVGSQYGAPVSSLNNTSHTVYLDAAAERTIAIEPYLSNLSATTATGYLDIGYPCQVPYGDCLWVQQTVYNTSGTTTRTGWVYYEVVVDDIQTNLLYRPERNDRYITIICAGALLFGVITVLRVVRHD